MTRAGLLLALLGGCSAIVDPDPSLLGDVSASDMGPAADGGGRDTGPVQCPGGCDDGVPCTEDQCLDGRCLQAPSDALCAADERCDVLSGCVPNTCTTDADCGSDGIDCNGIETCAGGMCRTSPGLVCDDGDPCTDDFCDPGGCATAPIDADGDGAPARAVAGVRCEGGTDCADDDAGRYPGAAEVCDAVDQDCDGNVDEGLPMCRGGTGDTCGDVVVVPLDGAGAGSYRTTLSASFSNDYDTPCGSGSGRDIVLAVDFTGVRDFRIDTSGSSFDTVVAASTDCGSFAVGGWGCNDDIRRRAGNYQSRLWVHRVGQPATPNRLYILVEGYEEPNVGDLVVDIQMRDAVTDRCDGALNISAGGSVLGFAGGAMGAAGSETGSCLGFEGTFSPEGSFVIEPMRRRLQLTARSDQFSPDMYVRLTCSPDTEFFCQANSDPSGLRETVIDQDMPFDGLPADVNVFVDGATSGAAYTLDYQP